MQNTCPCKFKNNTVCCTIFGRLAWPRLYILAVSVFIAKFRRKLWERLILFMLLIFNDNLILINLIPLGWHCAILLLGKKNQALHYSPLEP
uniref:Uncharacterized protein n=1 Tax=Anguilla anguilla TaxID=7936 RepID=A0A0E9X6Y8_ANGAN